MARRWIYIFIIACLCAGKTFADETPVYFTYQGRLLNSAGTAPLGAVVDIQFQIYNPSGTCLLYEERHSSVDLIASSGIFALEVGSPLGSLKRTASDPGLTMTSVLANAGLAVRTDDSGTTNTCPGGYIPSNGDSRLLRVTVIEGGVPTVLTPDQKIGSQPYATVAQTLQGYGPNGFIRVNGAVNLTQANMELLVSGNDASSLHHHDSVYVKKGDTANQNLGSGDVYTTGRIGVGTSLPATDIEIERTNPTFRMEASSGGAGSSQIQFYSGSTERARIESPESSSELRFYTGGTAALTIDSNQNASFVGNIRTNGFLDLGDYDNAAETALLTYLGTCGVGCTGTIWYSETAGKLRVWDGGGYSTLGDMSTASTDLDMNGHDISNVNNLGVATLSAGSISATSAVIGGVTISGGLITNLSAPTASGDATNKGYVDAAIAAISVSASGDYVARDGSSALTANWDVGGFDLTNLGNISLAGQKTVNLGVFTNAQESTATLSMGAGDAGKFWFNSSTNELKYWTGSQVNSLGVSGGALGSLNGETGAVQTFGTPGTTGLDPNWVSSSNVHTLHIPMASGAGVNAGLISRAEYDTFMNKQPAGDYLLRDGSLSMTGALNLAGNLVNNVATPVGSNDAANKGYVDAAIGALSTASGGAYLTIANNLSDLNNAATARTNLGLGSMAEETATDYLLRDGSLSMTGALNLAGNAINNVAAPSSGGDATNKTYVDTAVAAVSTASSGSYLTIANNLSDLNNAATARTNLGLGSMAEETATDYLLRDGSLSMTGALNLAGNDLNNGGTLNATSLASIDAVIGSVTISSGRVQNLSAPTDANDAARKAYVDAAVAAVSTSAGGAYLAISNNLSDLNNAATARTNLGLGSMAEETATDYLLRDGSLSMTGALNLAGNTINNVATPSSGGDATNKTYVDTAIAAVSTSAGNDYVKRDGSSALTGDWNVGGYILSNATLRAVAGSQTTPGFAFNGDADTGVYSPGANTIAMSTGGSQRLTIDSVGNVGIGTTTPSVKLDVVGTIKGTQLDVDNLRLDGNTLSSADVNGAITITPTNTDIDLAGNDLTILNKGGGRNAEPGNVNIGTGGTSNYKSGDINIYTGNSSANDGGDIFLTAGDSAYAGGAARDGGDIVLEAGSAVNATNNNKFGGSIVLRPGYNSGDLPRRGHLDFEYYNGTSYTNGLRFDGQTGFVGIGTISPGTRLDVAGTIKVGDGGETCGASYVGGIRYNGGNLQFCNGTSWQSLGVAGSGLTSLNGQTGNTQSFAIGTSGTIPSWSSGSDTHTLNIPLASAANVGAGLLSKADYDTLMAKQDAGDYLLRDGSLSMTGALNLAGNLVNNVATPVASGDAANKGYVDAAVAAVSSSAGTDYVKRDGSSTLTGNWDVGGYILSNATLRAIAGSEGTPGFAFDGDPDTGIYSPGANTIAMGTGGSRRFTIDSSGNVGIGTIAPGMKLDVDGNVRVNAQNSFFANYTNGDAYRGHFHWNTLQLGNNGGNYIIAGNDATGGSLQFYVNNTNEYFHGGPAPDGINIMSLDETGRVGIGTIAPGTKLEVAGTIKIGDGGETCGASYVGGIRYNGGNLQFCNGTSWQTLGVSGSGLTSLNGQTGNTQNFAIGTSGTVPNWSSGSDTHTLNIPLASSAGVGAGLLSKADYDILMAKQDAGDYLLRDGSLSMTGALNLAGNQINNIATPVASTDAANKSYVDAAIGALSTASSGDFLAQDGSTTLTANWDVGGFQISNVSSLGVGSATPHASAAAEISSTTKGFLPPRMTTAQRNAISSPAEGLIVYDLDADSLFIRKSGAWQDLSDTSGVIDGLVTQDLSIFSTTSACPTYVDVPDSSKLVNLAADGNIVISWSLGFYFGTGGGGGTARVCIGGTCGGTKNFHSNEGNSHKHLSGQWAPFITSGSHTVKLQVCHRGGANLAMNHDDSLSWAIHTGNGSSGGGGGSDNLGDHTASQNILLSGNWLSGDGDSEGLFVDSAGNVSVSGTLSGDGSALTNINATAIADGSIPISKLDFASTNGINIPQLASDPGSATAGQMYYNTTSNKLFVYNGSSWQEVGSGSGGGSTSQIVRATGASTSVANEVWTVLDLSGAAIDTDSIVDASTDRVTPTEPGYYFVSATVRSVTAFLDGSRLFGSVAVNGTNIIESYGKISSASADDESTTATGIIYLNGTTDYVQVKGYHKNGSTHSMSVMNLSLAKLGGGGSSTATSIAASSSPPGSPTEGTIYFDTDDNLSYVYNGSSWEPLGSSSGGGNATWVNFDGSNCPSNICVIRSSNNVTSVQRLAAGLYQINFSQAFSNTNYLVYGSAGQGGNGFANSIGLANNSAGDYKQTGYAKVVVTTPGNTYFDSPDISVHFGEGLGSSGTSTSMFPGWPDAIVCKQDTDASSPKQPRIFTFQGNYSNGDDRLYYSTRDTNYIIFNSDQTYNSESSAAWAVECLSKSITTLKSEGKAFNFVGVGNDVWAESGGNVYRDSGNVGIGTSAPGANLEVAGSASAETRLTSTTPVVQGRQFVGNSGGIDRMLLGTITNHPLALQTNNSTQMTILETGNVGIGTTSPTTKLDLNDNPAGYFTALTLRNSQVPNNAGQGVGIDFRHFNDGRLQAFIRDEVMSSSWDTNLHFGASPGANGAATRMTIQGATGNVGIGTTSPSRTLELQAVDPAIVLNGSGTNGNGTISFQKNGTNRWNLFAYDPDGHFYLQGSAGTNMRVLSSQSSWSATSDARLKTNIQEVSVLDRVKDFRAVSYDWKQSGTHELGVVAQEVYHSFPEVVDVGSSGQLAPDKMTGVWSVRYDRLAPLALQGVKEISQRIDVSEAPAHSSSIKVDKQGYVGIGTTTPDQLLSVNGNASKVGGGSWATYSDARLKTVHGPFVRGLQEILKLKPISYNYNSDNPLGIANEGEHIGFVAQDIERVIPEAVSYTKDGYLMVDNDPILWTMLNAVKELHGMCKISQEQLDAITEKDKEQDRAIASLKEENEELKKENAEIKARLERLEKILLNQ